MYMEKIRNHYLYINKLCVSVGPNNNVATVHGSKDEHVRDGHSS